MGKCEGKHGHELPCFGRGDCDTPGCYRNRRVNCGLGDPTWKERHAKGVPVKPSFDDVDKVESTDQYHHVYHYFPDGSFSIDIREVSEIPYQFGPLIASFCNFRYRPEWLVKNKRIVCSDPMPPTQHRGA